MAEARNYALEKSKKCEQPMFCQIEGCNNRQGRLTKLCKARNYLKHLWQKLGYKHMYFCHICEKYFWCPGALFSHKQARHGEVLNDCIASSKALAGTEPVWSYLAKKHKQFEQGDVVFVKLDKLNENHKTLMRLYPRKAKKVKKVKETCLKQLISLRKTCLI